ncbi:MAG: hypothetical protein AABY22_26735, partial [Nanoarchaeota archaeon]
CDYTEFKDFLLSSLEQKDKALTEYKAGLVEKVERLKLECDIVVCDCGSPLKEWDMAGLVDEVLSLINSQ